MNSKEERLSFKNHNKGSLKPQPMVGWYNVRQLITTGLKSIISNLFGSYADRREIQAAISARGFFDYSQQKDLWLDYVADLGDGFDSTFTVATLLAADQITVDDHVLKRANILLMGGDQVYPVANKKYYESRMLYPYSVAYPKDVSDLNPPHLFAIPGNHDWYDGLGNFLKIFINDRHIGNWVTKQHRSYFALKLRENLWLWGIDIQLEADIDRPQLDYFESISLSMKPKDKVILCNSKPSWTYTSKSEKVSYDVLEFFEKKYIVEKDFDLILSLAGDSHHYSRYSKKEGGSHKITSGGGGAFLHPTQHLNSKIKIREGELELKKIFPLKRDSFRLLFLNIFFPILNPEFSAFMGILYLFISWLLQSGSMYNPVFGLLSNIEPSWWHVPLALQKISHVIMYSPGLLIIIIGIFLGSIAFADKNAGKLGLAYTAGILHGISHIISGLTLIWILSYWSFHDRGNNLESIFVFSAGMILLGGLSGSFILGIYLLFSSLIGIHDNEAYSSIKQEGFKNYLRIHITDKKITIYPIGLSKIVKWKLKNGYIEGKKPQPHFIENPIEVIL
jgi:hypothetical protein